jgi:hypothetical protein
VLAELIRRLREHRLLNDADVLALTAILKEVAERGEGRPDIRNEITKKQSHNCQKLAALDDVEGLLRSAQNVTQATGAFCALQNNFHEFAGKSSNSMFYRIGIFLLVLRAVLGLAGVIAALAAISARRSPFPDRLSPLRRRATAERGSAHVPTDEWQG